MAKIYVTPISGSCFGIQLASLSLLCMNKYRPDICCTGSGGTIVCYCGLAGDWKTENMATIVSNLNSSVFLQKRKNPFYGFISDDMFGYFSGSLHISNPTPEKFMEKYFTSESLTRTEIWTGTINEKTGRLALFTNMGYDKSKIQGEYFNSKLYNSEGLKYFNGNMINISRGMIASCSIPIMLNPRDIGKDLYIDCGVKYASSLTALQDEIVEIGKQKKGLHITYLSGYNVEKKSGIHRCDSTCTLDLIEKIPNHVVRGMVLNDRSVAYNMIKNFVTDDVPLMYAVAPIRSLRKVLKIREKSISTLLEIYPIKSIEVDIFDFSSDDLVKTIHNMQHNLGIRLWWTGDVELFNEVPNIMIARIR